MSLRVLATGRNVARREASRMRKKSFVEEVVSRIGVSGYVT